MAYVFHSQQASGGPGGQGGPQGPGCFTRHTSAALSLCSSLQPQHPRSLFLRLIPGSIYKARVIGTVGTPSKEITVAVCSWQSNTERHRACAHTSGKDDLPRRDDLCPNSPRLALGVRPVSKWGVCTRVNLRLSLSPLGQLQLGPTGSFCFAFQLMWPPGAPGEQKRTIIPNCLQVQEGHLAEWAAPLPCGSSPALGPGWRFKKYLF